MILRITILIAVASCAVQADEPPVAKQTPAARVNQPPLPTAPLDFFRQLLPMTAEQREAALEKYSPKAREFVTAKLKEYEAMPPAERENRLRTIELRRHLLALMRMAPTNRAVRIQAVPERDRPLVEERLRLWDRLSPEVQRDVLECEPAMAAFASTGTQVPTSSTGSPLSSNMLARINQSMAYLNELQPEKRAELYHNFQEFFELSEKEKARALDSLDTLSDAERKQMERTLQTFNRLPREQRDQCIAGFQKFTALSRDEQEQFLRSVARWQAMSPRDRETWRSLVRSKAIPRPPLPPGLPHAGWTLPRNSLASTNR
jgi:hypothetical protein